MTAESYGAAFGRADRPTLETFVHRVVADGGEICRTACGRLFARAKLRRVLPLDEPGPWHCETCFPNHIS